MYSVLFIDRGKAFVYCDHRTRVSLLPLCGESWVLLVRANAVHIWQLSRTSERNQHLYVWQWVTYIVYSNFKYFIWHSDKTCDFILCIWTFCLYACSPCGHNAHGSQRTAIDSLNWDFRWLWTSMGISGI